MKIMLLANESPEDFAQRENKAAFESYMGAWYAFSEGISKNCKVVDSAALAPPSTATVVSVRNGVREVQDGPYADTKEQLGGFFILEASTMDEALEWAAQCPATKTGFTEIRPVMEIEMGDPS